jgi:hypothetical protein
MEREVPTTASEEIELYLRTVYSLLRSTAEVQIRTLEEVHASMNSTLHPYARSQKPDISAFIYSLLRLPRCIHRSQTIILAQTPEVFAQHGYEDVEQWEAVTARARRRRCFYNGCDTLACFIASRSDIDDVVPAITAFQIEWNKIHYLLKQVPNALLTDQCLHDEVSFNQLAEQLLMDPEDLQRLQVIWGNAFCEMLVNIRGNKSSLRIHLLNGSLIQYARATRSWWDNIAKIYPDINSRPIYFMSSNTHSPINLLTGFALQYEDEIIEYIQNSDNTELQSEWFEIQANTSPSSRSNFLYYVYKKYVQSPQGEYLIEKQLDFEKQSGIVRIPSEHSFDVEAQIYDLAKLQTDFFDPRLNDEDYHFLKESNALILNIDYPLGMAAYNILTKTAEHSGSILGVYIMGKAATLNGVHGDVMIPSVVHDEHSHNTYLLKNAFTAADISPYLVYGTVLDNQKALTVLGTFIQNARIMDIIYREGYSDLEMEAGPYLSAVSEMHRPTRHPVNEILNLYGLNFDLGILHYASDTPMSKGKNLGAGTLSYLGMDSTYATTIAILRRIFQLERSRLS